MASKTLRTWGAIALVALVGYEVLGSWWNNSLSAFTLVSETYSPSGKFKAVIFTEDCGQLCEFENEVSIIGSRQEADADTNRVFRSFPIHGFDDVHHIAPVIAPLSDYPVWISVKWVDDHHVRIVRDQNTSADEAKQEVLVGSLLFGGDRIFISYTLAK